VKLRWRFWVESALAVLAGALAVVTIVWPDWIELLFGVEPDEGNGSLEVMITVAAACLAIAFSLLAGFEWRSRARSRAT
jgi:hypothetical protein